MHHFSFAALIAAPLLMAAPAFAATDIPLPPFTGISVHGGGHVILKHGTVQHVTMLKGDPKISQLQVVHGTLDVSPCPNTWNCPLHNYDLEVEIVSPNITAIEAHGGGDIEAKGDFPTQAQMSVAAHGGGDVDIRVIPVEHVSAEAHGGGDIHVKALVSLSASVHGGGDITYAGNPKVSASTHGGGDVHHE
jgi:Putative auto-transporter adhesin, head GIN domain